MSTNKEQAIAKVKKASNSELEKFIFKFAKKDVSVNFVTRPLVESSVIKELDKYSDAQIGDFLKKIA